MQCNMNTNMHKCNANMNENKQQIQRKYEEKSKNANMNENKQQM